MWMGDGGSAACIHGMAWQGIADDDDDAATVICVRQYNTTVPHAPVRGTHVKDSNLTFVPRKITTTGTVQNPSCKKQKSKT